MSNLLSSYSIYFDKKRQELEKEFAHFLHFKTISAHPESLEECQLCAQWIQEKLSSMGFDTSLWGGDSFPPVVFGHMKGDPSKPTLLIYNHYDVQPVDPIEKWRGNPFSATGYGDTIIARGASDNKGQAFYILTALSYFYERNKSYPCSLSILMEGEEESSSSNLSRLLQEHQQEIQADYAMIVDLGMRNPSSPAITLGTRGILGLTLEVTGTREDLHSGVHGGLAYNPLHALVEMLAKMRDETGRIAIAGFYDGIVPSSQECLSMLCWTFDHKEYESTFGQPPTGGEKQLHPLERTWLQPTVEINGITGGYGGPGVKTVIPSKASAKLSCRLVPGQEVDHIGDCLIRFFETNTPEGVHSKVTLHEGRGTAVRTDPSSPCIRMLAQAMTDVFHRKPEYIFEGASIPIVPEIARVSQADIIMWGLGLPTDNIHAPNEEFDWSRIKQGFLITCRTIELLGNINKAI